MGMNQDRDPEDSEFYRNRERQERELADSSPDPAIAAIHRDLADRYAAKARQTARPFA